MAGLENGWKDPKKTFLPVDEISHEHLAPEYVGSVPQTPEEILLNEEAEGPEGWGDWIGEQFSAGAGDVGEDETDENFAYWARVRQMAYDYEEGGQQLNLDDFIERYDLPNATTRGEIEQLIARGRKDRSKKESTERAWNGNRAEGKRGREVPNKHLKGKKTIRRPDGPAN